MKAVRVKQNIKVVGLKTKTVAEMLLRAAELDAHVLCISLYEQPLSYRMCYIMCSIININICIRVPLNSIGRIIIDS